jgi:hypothetical protein
VYVLIEYIKDRILQNKRLVKLFLLTTLCFHMSPLYSEEFMEEYTVDLKFEAPSAMDAFRAEMQDHLITAYENNPELGSTCANAPKNKLNEWRSIKVSSKLYSSGSSEAFRATGAIWHYNKKTKKLRRVATGVSIEDPQLLVTALHTFKSKTKCDIMDGVYIYTPQDSNGKIQVPKVVDNKKVLGLYLSSNPNSGKMYQEYMRVKQLIKDNCLPVGHPLNPTKSSKIDTMSSPADKVILRLQSPKDNEVNMINYAKIVDKNELNQIKNKTKNGKTIDVQMHGYNYKRDEISYTLGNKLWRRSFSDGGIDDFAYDAKLFYGFSGGSLTLKNEDKVFGFHSGVVYSGNCQRDVKFCSKISILTEEDIDTIQQKAADLRNSRAKTEQIIAKQSLQGS